MHVADFASQFSLLAFLTIVLTVDAHDNMESQDTEESLRCSIFNFHSLALLGFLAIVYAIALLKP
jgi:hypothetical protein